MLEERGTILSLALSRHCLSVSQICEASTTKKGGDLSDWTVKKEKLPTTLFIITLTRF